MRAAVDDVHQRDRQDVCVRAADPAVEREARVGGRGLRDRERRAEDRVRAEPRLRRRPVELRSARGRSRAGRARRGPTSASAISPSTWATARETPLPSQSSPPSRSSTASCSPGRRARRHRGEPERTRVEADLDLDGRVPPRVEHLPGVDVDDLAHARSQQPSPAAEPHETGHPRVRAGAPSGSIGGAERRAFGALVPALLRVEVELASRSPPPRRRAARRARRARGSAPSSRGARARGRR